MNEIIGVVAVGLLQGVLFGAVVTVAGGSSTAAIVGGAAAGLFMALLLVCFGRDQT